MTELVPTNVIETWNFWGRTVAYILYGIGFLILVFHAVRLLSTKDYKAKYDYISKSEINLLWYSSLFIIVATVIFTNTFIEEISYIWVFVRGFVSVMLGFIAGVVLQNVLKFYYPYYVEKRLKKLRYTPRVSPKTGKPMKLLSEDEEDVYLDEGMQAEEDAFSVDYDVWIDEDSGFTKIEKYNGRLHALRCPSCNYQTLKVVKEEIMKAPSASEEGELMKYYQCAYCNHKEKKFFHIAPAKEDLGAEKSTVTTSS